MKYVNENGVVIETTAKVSGNGWKEVVEKKPEEKKKGSKEK